MMDMSETTPAVIDAGNLRYSHRNKISVSTSVLETPDF
jgi:hypothetical protein